MGEVQVPMRERVSRPSANSWELLGYCRRGYLNPDAWFPMTPEDPDGQAAKRMCDRCPVREACLEEAFAVPETHGIWGGTDEDERRLLRRRRRRA